MIRSASVLAGVVLVLGNGATFAQSRTIPKQFDNVRPLGRALSEFKDDRIQIVTSYVYSQVNHGSRWLLIEFGAVGRTRMRVERDRIELVTPDGRRVSHSTPDRWRDASDFNGLLLQLPMTRPSRFRIDSYLPSILSFTSRDYRFFNPPPRATELEPMDMEPHAPTFADLLFESPTGSWDEGKYALVVPYDSAEAVLPIELR
jgi:hypothetical protein